MLTLAQEFTSSNLPIVVINTNSQTIFDEPKIIAHMGIIANGPGVRNNVTDPFNNYDGLIAIERRGSSSQFFFPKQQYALELRTQTGEDLDTTLLGLPSEEDWILFAPYNDKTLMRDVLAYKLGSDLGRYAPRTRFCELILNGSYQGVYVLIEKIKQDKNRVDISKLNPDENSGDDLTGGYIVKIDKSTGAVNDGWISNILPGPSSAPINFLYHYPDPLMITAAQKNYIQNYVSSFESVLQSSSFDDQLDGYTRYIDVNSFIDFMIMNELTKNVDGYRLSTFFYKDKDSNGGKLVMGPLWDFNLGFGNADYCTLGNPEGLVLDFNLLCSDHTQQIPFWWTRFLQDPAFTGKLNARWKELRNDKLSVVSIHDYIDSVAAMLDEAQTRNFVRWPVLGEWVWPNYFVGDTYQSEVAWLKDWVSARTLWLDNAFAAYVTTGVDEPRNRSLVIELFENPFSTNCQIKYTLTGSGLIQFRLYDVMGRQVCKYEHFCNEGETGLLHMGETLMTGVYLLKGYVNGVDQVFMRLVKQ